MAQGNMERIQVILQAVTAGFARGLGRAQTQLKKSANDMRAFGQVMGMPLDRLKKLNGRFKVMRSRGGKLAFNMRKLTHGMRGFRMEMLGVMFFGMSLTRIFKSLTRTSLEWMGTTEILSSALGLLFLPIAEKLTDWALIFLDWVGQLTEKQKKWIGGIVLVVGAIGVLLTIIGTLALGIGSLISVFGSSLGFVAGLVGGLIVLFTGIALVVGGLYLIVKGKLEGIGLVIMGIGVILLAFGLWWAWIPIVVGAAIFLIIKYWDNVKSFLKDTFSAIGGWFKKWFWVKPKEWLSSLWGFVKNIFGKIKDKVSGSLFGKGLQVVGGLLGSFQTGGIVPQTGPYLLHQGETVVPTNQGSQTTIAPTINIQATVAADYDVRRLAEQIQRYLVNDFERLSQRRGSV